MQLNNCWIDASISLPEKYGQYLVWVTGSFPKNTHCVIAEYYDDNNRFYTEDGSSIIDATHWMNLPDNPINSDCIG